MYLFEHGKQPHIFDDYFHYVKDISSYNSRIAERNDFYLPLFIYETHPTINQILRCKNLE